MRLLDNPEVVLTSGGEERRVSVRFGSPLKREDGLVRETVAVSAGSTVSDLITRLARAHPEIGRSIQLALPIVNGCHGWATQELCDRDELALVVPMAGGSLLTCSLPVSASPMRGGCNGGWIQHI